MRKSKAKGTLVSFQRWTQNQQRQRDPQAPLGRGVVGWLVGTPVPEVRHLKRTLEEYSGQIFHPAPGNGSWESENKLDI